MKRPNKARIWLSVEKVKLEDNEEYNVIFIPEWIIRAYRPNKLIRQVECVFHNKAIPFKKRRIKKSLFNYFKSNWVNKLTNEHIKKRRIKNRGVKND